MGEFLHAVAVRHGDAVQVAQAMLAHAAAFGVAGELVPGNSPDLDSVDVAVYEPIDGWAVLTWPFGGTETQPATARALSESLRTAASWLSLYDSDFWTHVLYDHGEERDRFASVPDYFENGPDVVATLRRQWAGDPHAVASSTGRPPEQFAPYLVHLLDDHEHGLAFPDDQAPLEQAWVCLDFWRRMGVHYPEHNTDPACGVEMPPNWQRQLPTSPELSL